MTLLPHPHLTQVYRLEAVIYETFLVE